MEASVRTWRAFTSCSLCHFTSLAPVAGDSGACLRELSSHRTGWGICWPQRDFPEPLSPAVSLISVVLWAVSKSHGKVLRLCSLIGPPVVSVS